MDLSIVKKIRKEKKLSQKDLGDLLGVSGAYIQQIENNKTNPSINTLQKIANALEMPLDNLISNSDSSHYDKVTLSKTTNLVNTDKDLESLTKESESPIKGISKFILSTAERLKSIKCNNEYLCDIYPSLSPRDIEHIYKMELDSLSREITFLEEKIEHYKVLLEDNNTLISVQSKLLDNSNTYLEDLLNTNTKLQEHILNYKK